MLEFDIFIPCYSSCGILAHVSTSSAKRLLNQKVRLCNMIVNAVTNSFVDIMYLCLTSITGYSF